MPNTPATDPPLTLRKLRGMCKHEAVRYCTSDMECGYGCRRCRDRYIDRQRSACCVYRFYSRCGALLYIGVANNALVRASQHEKAIWWHRAATMSIRRFSNRSLALAAEKEAIRTEKPIYNKTHRARARLRPLPRFDNWLCGGPCFDDLPEPRDARDFVHAYMEDTQPQPCRWWQLAESIDPDYRRFRGDYRDAPALNAAKHVWRKFCDQHPATYAP